MKDPREWIEDDLLELIRNKTEENIRLDYKKADSLQQSDSRKAEISKDVSAFANSAGGIIIYGIEESLAEPHVAESLSPIDPSSISKEWIEQVINSRIQPRISGLFINPVELQKARPGRFAYILVVPESTTAHQASDKRYYKRFNFQSVAMEDYEIRQTMYRASRPSYQLVLSVHSGRREQQMQYTFFCMLQNVSDIVGHEVSVVLFVPKSFVSGDNTLELQFEGIPYTRIGGHFIESPSIVKTAVPAAHPLMRYPLNFSPPVFVPFPPPALRFTLIAKVFDQHGISQTSTYRVHLPDGAIEQTGEMPGSRSQGIVLP